MLKKRSYNLYAAVTPSLELLLKKEILHILKKNGSAAPAPPQKGAPKLAQELDGKIKVDKGGVECADLTPEQLWSVAHYSRLAETLRVRMGPAFRATNFNMLKNGLKDLPWSSFYRVTEHTLPECSVSCSHSALYHSNAVKERVMEHFQKHVIFAKKLLPSTVAATGEARESKHSRLFVRVADDMAQMSVDACIGDSLHKRTPNKHVTDAPIRETLAAALLAAAGYSGQRRPAAIWDPFMGSGTILQEALAMAIGGRATPPDRPFAFESWPLHRDDKYSKFIERITQEQNDCQTAFVNSLKNNDNNNNKPTTKFYGSDIDQRAIDATKHNIYNQYKFLDNNNNDTNNNNSCIQLLHGDFKIIENKLATSLMKDGESDKLTIITNLPYGERILTGGSDSRISDGLKSTFITFGKMIKESRIIGDVYVLNGHPKFTELSGVQWKLILKFTNGGLPVEFLKMKK